MFDSGYEEVVATWQIFLGKYGVKFIFPSLGNISMYLILGFLIHFVLLQQST
jgi:hypothetical protein